MKMSIWQDPETQKFQLIEARWVGGGWATKYYLLGEFDTHGEATQHWLQRMGLRRCANCGFTHDEKDWCTGNFYNPPHR